MMAHPDAKCKWTVATVHLPRTKPRLILDLDGATFTAQDFQMLLRRLHTHIAALADAAPAWKPFLWTSIKFRSTVTHAMLESARNPDHPRLLHRSVYDAALDLAEVSPDHAMKVRQLYSVLERISTGDTLTFRPDRPQGGTMPHLRAMLAQITSQADMLDHLRVLRAQAGLSLRDIEKKMSRLDPKKSPSRSTLSGWLREQQQQLPRDRHGFRLLLQVLLPDYPEAARTAPVTQSSSCRNCESENLDRPRQTV